MEVAIKERSEGEAPSTVKSLVLDELKVKDCTIQDAEILAQYVELETLCINRTGLSNLSNFPPLPNLKKLELTDNFLNEKSNVAQLAQYTNLISMSLSGNKFRDIEGLKPLVALTSLVNLEIVLNPFTEADTHYRKTLFEWIPSLKVIDGEDRDGNDMEFESSDEDEDDEAERAARKHVIKEFYEKEISDDDEDDEEYNPIAEDESESSDDDDDDFEEEEGDVADDVEKSSSVKSGDMDMDTSKDIKAATETKGEGMASSI